MTRPNIPKEEQFGVSDEIQNSIKRKIESVWRYTRINHQWLIGLIIGMTIPIVVIFVQKGISTGIVTEEYYFAPNSFYLENSENLEAANCWSRSISVDRTDALRCVSDNIIHDPCFSFPNQRNVVTCPESPFGEELYFKVTYDEGFDANEKEYREKPDSPWFLILSDGSNCRFITGASTGVAGMRADYSCDSEAIKYLLLPIDESRDTKTINCWTGRSIDQCKIKEIWY